MKKHYYLYIMSNKRDTVFYTGVTNHLVRRIYEHKQKLVPGFTKKYNIVKLIYFEQFDDVEQAIRREKQIKGWRRSKKMELIHRNNQDLQDLYESLI